MASAPEIIEIPFDDLVNYLNQFFPGQCDFCSAKMSLFVRMSFQEH